MTSIIYVGMDVHTTNYTLYSEGTTIRTTADFKVETIYFAVHHGLKVNYCRGIWLLHYLKMCEEHFLSGI